jgi:hypothetical protein
VPKVEKRLYFKLNLQIKSFDSDNKSSGHFSFESCHVKKRRGHRNSFFALHRERERKRVRKSERDRAHLSVLERV